MHLSLLNFDDSEEEALLAFNFSWLLCVTVDFGVPIVCVFHSLVYSYLVVILFGVIWRWALYGSIGADDWQKVCPCSLYLYLYLYLFSDWSFYEIPIFKCGTTLWLDFCYSLKEWQKENWNLPWLYEILRFTLLTRTCQYIWLSFYVDR